MTLIDASSRFRVPEFDLHDRLAKARSNAAITQERMAELLGCSRRTIVRYESSGIVPRSVVLAYHVATTTDLRWLESGIAAAPSPDPVGPAGIEPTTSSVKAGRLTLLRSAGAPRLRELANVS